jgi:hypothetical protein
MSNEAIRRVFEPELKDWNGRAYFLKFDLLGRSAKAASQSFIPSERVLCSLSGGGKKLSVRRAERKGRIGHLSCRGVTSEPWRVNPAKQARRSKANHHPSENKAQK